MLAKARKSILIIVATTFLVGANSPTDIKASQKASQLSRKEVERLRQMFRGSHKLATESLDELNILRHLQEKFGVHSSGSMGQNGLVEKDSHKLTVHRDGKDHDDNQYQISSKMADNPRNGTATTAKAPADDDIVVEERPNPQGSNLHSDSYARQSSLFSGFNFPANPALGAGLAGSNPFLSRLAQPPSFPILPSLPTLPALPTFPLVTPKPPKPAKSSIISNTNGGPMALTNDNVVVVNVLSNNY